MAVSIGTDENDTIFTYKFSVTLGDDIALLSSHPTPVAATRNRPTQRNQDKIQMWLKKMETESKRRQIITGNLHHEMRQ